MLDFTKEFWRAAAVIAAVAFVLMTWLYDGAREELADMRATATANEKAAKDTTASAAIADNSAVKHVRAVTATAAAKETAKRNAGEAKRDETYRTWADTSAPSDTFRLLREAVPAGSDSGSAAPVAPGAVPGTVDTGKRH